MSGEVFIGGHSLGAADAFLYAYSRAQRGLRVDGVFAFAPPRPGDAAIGKGLRARTIPVRSIKNKGDGVTDVPFDAHVDERGWDYADAYDFEMIDQPASFSDFLVDPFFCHHHIQHYVAGSALLPPGDLAITLFQAVAQVTTLYNTADGWDWINPVDGLYWAMRRFSNGARLMIRRGSKTGKDWLTEDFDFDQIPVLGAKMSRGFWSGVEPVQDQLDAQLA